MAERRGPAHVPVMLERVVDALEPSLGRSPAVVIDATLGMGGHAEALLRRYAAIRLIGIDRDPQALELAGGRLAEFGDRFTAVHAVYDHIGDVLADQGLDAVQGVVFDLGVSSVQLDEAERGFSYARDAPLDMRMDQTAGTPTAADVLNSYPVESLKRILRDYGEERFAARIAREIVRVRAERPFSTSSQLVELLDAVIPAPARRTGGHPAKRTFQALRIEVNDELTTLQRALNAAIEAISVGGRLAALSYHSLEDRLVKRAIAAGATSSAPPGLPVELPQHRPYLRVVGKAQTAGDDEIDVNPRAASARLRVAERIRETNTRTGAVHGAA